MDRWTVRDWPREKCFLERGGGEKDNKSKQGAPHLNWDSLTLAKVG